jgi:hypothetical protein
LDAPFGDRTRSSENVRCCAGHNGIEPIHLVTLSPCLAQRLSQHTPDAKQCIYPQLIIQTSTI